MFIFTIECVTWNNTGHSSGIDGDTTYINYLCKGLRVWLCTLFTSGNICVLSEQNTSVFCQVKAKTDKTEN